MARKPYKLPQKKALRTRADTLWSYAIREDWAWECAVCGDTFNLQAHHLIEKSRCNALRYEMRNGICLCATHHTYDSVCSPHAGPIGFTLFLQRNHPHIVEWVEENNHQRPTESVSQGWYLGKMIELQPFVPPEHFTRIVGVNLAAHLEAM